MMILMLLFSSYLLQIANLNDQKIILSANAEKKKKVITLKTGPETALF